MIYQLYLLKKTVAVSPNVKRKVFEDTSNPLQPSNIGESMGLNSVGSEVPVEKNKSVEPNSKPGDDYRKTKSGDGSDVRSIQVINSDENELNNVEPTQIFTCILSIFGWK